MKGRRLPVNDDGTFQMPTEPGDYVGPVREYPGDGKPSVYFLLPIARDPDVPPGARSVHRVASPPHTFTEEPDGTLTISASIGAGPQPYYWHGFLERGEWWTA